MPASLCREVPRQADYFAVGGHSLDLRGLARDPERMPLRPALLAALVATIWGANFVVIDLGIDGIPPTLFVAMRFVLVLVPAVFVVPRPAARWRDVLAVGAFMSLGQFGLLYSAIALGLPAGLASLVLQAQVAFTVVLAALTLRERPSRPQVVGVVIGVVGLTVVGLGRQGTTPALAFLLCLAAALAWATGNVISRRIGNARGVTASGGEEADPPSGKTQELGNVSATTGGVGTTTGNVGIAKGDRGDREGTTRDATAPRRRASSASSGLSLTVWSALVVPVPMAALSLLIDGPDAVGHALTHLGVAPLLSTAYTAWLASLVGYGIWNSLLGRYPASAVVPFTMLVPVVGMGAAWLVLQEAPNVAEAIGGVILLLGVAVTTGVLGRRRRSAGRPSATGDRPTDPTTGPTTGREVVPVSAK